METIFYYVYRVQRPAHGFSRNYVHEERASEIVFHVLKLKSDIEIISKVCGRRFELEATEPLSKMGEQEAKTVEMVL